MDDIELFGLTYLQKISDASQRRGASHRAGNLGHPARLRPIPPEQPPPNPPGTTPPADGQIVAEDGDHTPRGTRLAQVGSHEVLRPSDAHRRRRSVRVLGLPVRLTAPRLRSGLSGQPLTLNATGSSEKLTAPALPAPPPPPFPEYDLGQDGEGRTTRARLLEKNQPSRPCPPAIDGVAMQDVINDPVRLLQATIDRPSQPTGTRSNGVALNIATQTSGHLSHPTQPAAEARRPPTSTLAMALEGPRTSCF